MKELPILFVLTFGLAICYSCQFSAGEKAEKNSSLGADDFEDDQFSIEQVLVGEWGVYVEMNTHSGVAVMCNQCPDLVIKSNGKARRKMGDQNMELYNWKLKGDTLFLEAIDGGKRYFGHTKYLAESRLVKDEFFELSLTADDGTRFIMRK